MNQKHDYGYHPQGRQGVFSGAEAGRNCELAGGWRHLRTVADATEALRKSGMKTNRQRHWSTAKRYARQGARSVLHGGIERVWFFLLGLTRPVRRKLGLNAENLRRLLSRTVSALIIFVGPIVAGPDYLGKYRLHATNLFQAASVKPSPAQIEHRVALRAAAE